MPSRANLPTGYSCCWVPGDIMSNPFYDLYWHEPNTGELLFNLLLYEFKHITKKGRMCVTMIAFSQLGFMDQRCSETPQSVTKKMDIRGLHSAEGHCYLQYSQPYSAWFTITNWIDYLITIIIVFTYDVHEWIAMEDNQYASTGLVVWLTTTPRWQCGSIRA